MRPAAALRVWGAVQTPLEMSDADFEGLPRAGAPLSPRHSERRGEGVAVAALLERAGPRPEATHVRVAGADGFSGTIPLDEFLRLGVLLFRAQGRPLSPEQGGPFRLAMEGSSNPCASLKGVVSIEVRTGPFEPPPNPHVMVR